MTSTGENNQLSGALLLGGPTACGKSAVALHLAEALGGEIISVDSMQVYRGMDIGTAKPSAEDRARVRHHLIDVVDVNEWFDAARFAEMARGAVSNILSRGRIPILCGGTGLYFRALLEGVGEAPAGDPALKAVLRNTPLEQLLSELRERDPSAYDQIDRRNPRRVIRAVEVIRLTGRPFSQQRAQWQEAGSTGTQTNPFFALRRQPEDLKARIEVRVDEMFRRGLVEETRALLDRGLAWNLAAMQALGYRQVVEHLRGQRSLPETIELVKSRTRKFAKRQMTWFRNQASVTWIDVRRDDESAQVASEVRARLTQRKDLQNHLGRVSFYGAQDVKPPG